MELIRLEYTSFRDFARELSPRLTREGLWLASEAPLPLGAEVALEIDLADGFRLLRGRGEVTASVADGPTGARGMAVAFRELDAASRHLVEKMVARHCTAGGSALVLPPAIEAAAAAAPAAEEPTSAGAPGLAPFEEERLIGELMVAELEEMLAREDEGTRETEQVEEQSTGPAVPRPIRTREALEPAGPPADLDWLAEPRPTVRRWRPGSLVRWAAVLVVVAGLAWIAVRLPRREPDPAPQALVGGAQAVPPPNSLSTRAVPSVVPDSPATPEAPAPFSRVLEWSGSRHGPATVVHLDLDGVPEQGRWVKARIAGERPRELLRLFGVATLPRPETLELTDPLVVRMRSGLHSGTRGPELHLVADLADPGVRLAGVEAGERSLRLVFLRD